MVPFAEGKRSREFGRALVQKMVRRIAELQEKMISAQNVCNMPHGHGWTFQQQRKEGFAPETGEFKLHSTEVRFHTDRILSNDLNVVQELILEMAQRMYDEFEQSVLREVQETCVRFEQVTNVPKGESLADGILASLADIHASVDADGNVSLPQMMLTPDLIERLQMELIIRGKELERKAAEIRAKTEQDARDRETERLAKYDRQ